MAAYRRGTVVIAEVKTRAGRSGGRPAAAVDYDKQDRLRNTAAAFMRVHKRNGRIPVYSRLLRRQRPRPVKRLRFDVIEVYLDGKGGHTVNQFRTHSENRHRKGDSATMNYISTRTAQSEPRTASYVIREGIAPDGGLYVPDALPALDGETLQRLSEADYCGRASHILGLFLTDFTKEELAACASAAYAPERFGPSPAPISMLGRDAFLELWHGPTCAFKDMALQIMPWLLSLSIAKQGGGKDALILVATSGDTGKAALEGYRDVDRVRILVFYPTGGVSRIQQKQMATQEGANVGVVAIRGNFDDAQTAVKRVFGSAEMAREADAHGFFFSSANSDQLGPSRAADCVLCIGLLRPAPRGQGARRRADQRLRADGQLRQHPRRLHRQADGTADRQAYLRLEPQPYPDRLL